MVEKSEGGIVDSRALNSNLLLNWLALTGLSRTEEKLYQIMIEKQ